MPNNTTNHQITLQQAIDMTTLYRANRPADFPICETFNRSAVVSLLANNQAAYLRIYYGMKENGFVDAILVAANEQEEDLLPSENAEENNAQENVILEDGFRCPQYCPPASPLNS
ncbi:hypothetical protein BH10BAC2_BH10BAC2_18090 [soil metagenome]